jgi:hypothetical protein
MIIKPLGLLGNWPAPQNWKEDTLSGVLVLGIVFLIKRIIMS